jgi:hypothetical protein
MQRTARYIGTVLHSMRRCSRRPSLLHDHPVLPTPLLHTTTACGRTLLSATLRIVCKGLPKTSFDRVRGLLMGHHTSQEEPSSGIIAGQEPGARGSLFAVSMPSQVCSFTNTGPDRHYTWRGSIAWLAIRHLLWSLQVQSKVSVPADPRYGPRELSPV